MTIQEAAERLGYLAGAVLQVKGTDISQWPHHSAVVHEAVRCPRNPPRGIARARDAYESVAVQGAAWRMVGAARGVRGICSAAVAAALKHTERPPRSG